MIHFAPVMPAHFIVVTMSPVYGLCATGAPRRLAVGRQSRRAKRRPKARHPHPPRSPAGHSAIFSDRGGAEALSLLPNLLNLRSFTNT